MQAMFGAVVEILWWGLFTVIVCALAVRRVAQRWPQREAGVDSREVQVAGVIRDFEEEQLARMQAEGVYLWRPDPAKLKRISERQA